MDQCLPLLPACLQEPEKALRAGNLYPEPDSDATMYVFVPIETDNGEKGLAVIKSYGDIPGGEYELFDVFANQEEADKALEGKFWF